MLLFPDQEVRCTGDIEEYLFLRSDLLIHRAPLGEPVKFAHHHQRRRSHLLRQFLRPAKVGGDAAAHRAVLAPALANAVPLHDRFPYRIAHPRLHLPRAAHIGIPAQPLHVITRLQLDRETRRRLLRYRPLDHRAGRIKHHAVDLRRILRDISAHARATRRPADDVDASNLVHLAQVINHGIHFRPIVAYRVEFLRMIRRAVCAQGFAVDQVLLFRIDIARVIHRRPRRTAITGQIHGVGVEPGFRQKRHPVVVFMIEIEIGYRRHRGAMHEQHHAPFHVDTALHQVRRRLLAHEQADTLPPDRLQRRLMRNKMISGHHRAGTARRWCECTTLKTRYEYNDGKPASFVTHALLRSAASAQALPLKLICQVVSLPAAPVMIITTEDYNNKAVTASLPPATGLILRSPAALSPHPSLPARAPPRARAPQNAAPTPHWSDSPAPDKDSRRYPARDDHYGPARLKRR